jgi:hypothetical protein
VGNQSQVFACRHGEKPVVILSRLPLQSVVGVLNSYYEDAGYMPLSKKKSETIYRRKPQIVNAWFWTGIKADYDAAPAWILESSFLKNGMLRIENEIRTYLMRPLNWVVQVAGTKNTFPCTREVFERDHDVITL